MRTDTRIAYGAGCTWWDSVGKAASKDGTPQGLPCCPFCGSSLFEVPNEESWWAGVRAHEANGNPGYVALIEFGRGKCFPNFDALKEAQFMSERPEL